MNNKYLFLILLQTATLVGLYLLKMSLKRVPSGRRGDVARRQIGVFIAVARGGVMVIMMASFLLLKAPLSFTAFTLVGWALVEFVFGAKARVTGVAGGPRLAGDIDRRERKFRERAPEEAGNLTDDETVVLKSPELLESEPETPDDYFKWGQGYALGTGVPQDSARALGYYKRGAELGEYRCKLRMAKLYLTGREGVGKDPEKALEYFRDFSVVELTTRANLAWDILYYPLCLYFGRGCEADPIAAKDFLKTAADHNFTAAKELLYSGTSKGFGFLELEFPGIKKIPAEEFLNAWKG